MTADNSQFGRFTLLERLGEGGFGVVYRVWDPRCRMTFALKRIRDEWRTDNNVVQQFLTSDIAYKIAPSGLNVCEIYECSEINGVPYLTMHEYPGGSLRDRMDNVPWSPRAAVEMVLQLAGTMHEFHQLPDHEMWHLDLKPENVLFTEEEVPIIVDFGCALLLHMIEHQAIANAKGTGTIAYMAPEQVPLIAATSSGIPVNETCDIWSLGVILYELLAGRRPFLGNTNLDVGIAILNEDPNPPSAFNSAVPHALDAICAKALARKRGDRYYNMEAFRNALHDFWESADERNYVVDTTNRSLISSSQFQFRFLGYGTVAPDALPPDRLFLDVGNGLRSGVIDHHQDIGALSTTQLVLKLPKYLDAAVSPLRHQDAPFTILMHQEPDLDCVASCLLACSYLSTRQFPEGAAKLANYLDRIDSGDQARSKAFRSSLYVAFQILINRLSKQRFGQIRDQWEANLRAGMALAEAVLQQAVRDDCEVADVDAFAVAGGLGEQARQEVEADLQRYRKLLAMTASNARVGQLNLPTRDYGRREIVDVLLLREMITDPQDRCEMIKVWARADTINSPNKKGFVALSVCMPKSPWCMISVKPDAKVNLKGLGKRLEELEHSRRLEKYKKDDREFDPITNERLRDRPGYHNPDPWYDGRAHEFTILAGPRSETILSADDIENELLDFGEGNVALLSGKPLATNTTTGSN